MNQRDDLWSETRRVLRLWGDEIGRLVSSRRATSGEAATASYSHGRRRLYRSRRDRIVGGVCAGLADYLGLPVPLVRAAFVVLSLPGLVHGVLIYAVLAFLIPEAPVEETVL